ncbi:MAG: hypothetical protein WCI05_06295, partial [Myxococcales bacterium]
MSAQPVLSRRSLGLRPNLFGPLPWAAWAVGMAGMAVGSYVGSAEAADAPAHDGASPVRVTYLQYGIAFAVELPVGSAFCADPQLDCIFGTGGGIAGRLGLRLPGPWYLGAAYELSKHDSTKIYRLGILQQLRAEGRYYVFEGRDVAPFAGLGVGVSGYGNEWAV